MLTKQSDYVSFVNCSLLIGRCGEVIREFKQIATAGAATAAVAEKVWGEYVSTVRQARQSEIESSWA